MSDARPAILLIAPTRNLAFVAQDVAILASAYRVDVLERTAHPTLREFLAALVARLRAVRYSLVYVWFAEPYDSPFVVTAARAFGVKCAIVVGGYDVASLPALGYGALSRWAPRWKVKFALRAANALFPTSDLLAVEVRRVVRPRSMRVIYPGVDCAAFAPAESREPIVVTVGTIGENTWRLKGLDVFARCSRSLPGVEFVVVGPCSDDVAARELASAGGPNLTLMKRFVPPEELADLFRRATVYAQLSVRESFGLALAEAMSSGCVPVVSATGFMPDLVGETGFVVEYGNPEAAAAAIRRALAADGGAGARARARIQARFSLERRQRELLASVGELTLAPIATAA
jgi:glycosyltransferase involved in cell wall biosynthesis